MKLGIAVYKASKKVALLVTVATLALFFGLGKGKLSTEVRADSKKDLLVVQAQAARGAAASGNSLPANFLVVVTDVNGGAVANLTQSNFQIINHFGFPGFCGFSNNITSFSNIGTGAYQIQVELVTGACTRTWVPGDYLAQVIVDDGSRNGQTAVRLVMGFSILIID